MVWGIGSSSIAISVLSALNMGLGVVNQIVLANYFGTSAQLDTFFIASAIPSVIGGIALSLFSACLVPMVTPLGENKPEFSKAVTSVTIVTILGTGFMVAGGLVGRKVILEWTTALPSDHLDYTARLAGYIWIITGFVVLNALCGALLNVGKLFVLPACLGLLPTGGMILGTVTFGRTMGIEGLIVGWLGMTIVSFLGLLLMLRKVGIVLKAAHLSRFYLLQFLAKLAPVAIGLLPFTILPTIDAYWASQLAEGSMSSIGYCTRIVVSLGSLVVSGLQVVILPYLSENVSEGDNESFRRRLQLSIKYVLLLTIPLVAFCGFFGGELVTALFRRGQFTEASSVAVASLLPYYLVGLLAMAPATMLSRGFFALQRHRAFGLLSLVGIALYAVLSGKLSMTFGVYGIGISYAIYWIVFLAMSILLLDRTLLCKNTFTTLVKCFACSVAGAAISHFVFSVSPSLPGGVALILQGSMAMGLFLMLAYYFKRS